MANIDPIINVNALNPAANTQRVSELAQPAKPLRPESDAPESRRGEEQPRTEAAERERDNVIAVSRDGDTVQASDEAVRELNEEETVGRVIGNPDNARILQEQVTGGSDSRQELLELELERSAEIRKAQLEASQAESEARREQAREAAETAAPEQGREPNAVLADEEETIAQQGQINSFVGYSDAELERMYLQGSISKFDYDQEMESRAAEQDNRREALADFSLETASRAGAMERGEREGKEIERAFSNDANERLDAPNRAQILQAMQRTEQAQASDPNQIAPLANFALS